MLENLWENIRWLLGLDTDSLTVWQMAFRAFLVYGASLILVRIGEKRLIGENTAFDFILGIILGSVLAGAVTNEELFFPFIIAGTVLVLLHWLMARIAFYSDAFGTLVKGEGVTLVEDGEILWDAMTNAAVTEDDLELGLRKRGETTDVSKIRLARLERNGDISVIPKDEEDPKVLEVKVEDGVQTIRIELS
jgi:uncharacterized membrane protein YcaP (DUF421 family)